MAKVRHIDFYPDEYIAGCSGQLTPEQAGLYWTICTLIYSRGEDIPNDPKWLGNILSGTHPRTIKRILNDLSNMGKIVLKEGPNGVKEAAIWVERCGKELAKTELRISNAAANGKLGGRPTNKNNDLAKAGGLNVEKLTTNYQPSTTNLKDIQKKVGRKLSQDWKPSKKDIAYACERKIVGKALEDETLNFVDHFTNGNGKNSARPEWSKSWQTWCRNHTKFNPSLKIPASFDRTDEAAAAIERLANGTS